MYASTKGHSKGSVVNAEVEEIKSFGNCEPKLGF